MEEDLEAVEARIRGMFDGGRLDEATTMVIQHYGPEVLGFLVARLRSEADASEVFSMFCEDLWRGMPSFQWRCRARTWAYTLARHCADRYKKAAGQRVERNIPLSRAHEVSKIEADVRSRTLVFLRTETKSKMRELCERLPPDEQTLVILRIDKGLSWRDLAEVMEYDGRPPSNADLERATARYKKRFQAVKDKLRSMAIAEGLLD